MQLFYTDLIQDNHLLLSAEEAHHASKVLRVLKGEMVNVTDGKGTLYIGKVIQMDHKKGVIEIISSNHHPARPASLHIAIAPTKNIDRFEWFLEKACEFGIERITPVICKRSERKDLRTDRLQKILVSGMKQSLHFHLPVLDEPVSFRIFLQHSNPDALRCIAHCENSEKKLLSEIAKKKKDLQVLVGPEGDFSVEEIEEAKSYGFEEITLGSSRLRTETAGIAIAHTFSEILDLR